uniref:RanBP2-type domain-containing protein n=1 Tax=Kalanchoe fedtschenkoi TaxID=63787 RepID=A0A7N0TZI8_KALFE
MSWVGPGDWMCGACEHMNFKKRDSCQKCGYSKFGGPLPTDISSAYGCNRTEVLAGDWYCCAMSCGAHNYASRPSCYRCGAAKDDPYAGGYGANLMASCGGFSCDANGAIPGWKTGDWICARYGCGMHNYASRLECYKCKTPREYDFLFSGGNM